MVGGDGRAGLLAPLEDQVGEGEVHIDESQEAAQPAKYVSSPPQVSAEAMEQHRADHQPFRTWCKFCIMGRGLGQSHTASPEESRVAIVAQDYFYITSEGVQRREELDVEIRDDNLKIDEARRSGRIVKCIAVRCLASKSLFGHVVPVKGDDEEHYVAKLIVADIEWLGHTRVILKSDNEPSILALRRRVARMLKMNESFVNVQEENPVAYDSQSNGGIEVGIRIIRGLYRTLKLCLEARIGKYLPAAHPISAWLLQHTCVLLNARSVGSDGQTPWQRVKGRMFRQMLLCFGE